MCGLEKNISISFLLINLFDNSKEGYFPKKEEEVRLVKNF